MKQIPGSHHFIFSQIWQTALSLCECKLVFCLVLRRVNVGRICSSIAKDLKFDCSIQVTWKQRVMVNKIRSSIVAGTATQKLTNTPAAIFSYPCQSRWFIFQKQIIVLFWVIICGYLQRFFKIRVPGTLKTIHRKTTVSESYFLMKDSDIDVLLWILRSC